MYSCNNSNQADVSKDFEVPDSVLMEKPLEISEETMENIIQNISSPIEMASLIKSTGAPFSQKLLSPTDYVDEYGTNFKKALSLGVFGADLGYLNMYEKTGSVITHLSSIKSLADDLKVGQFFDFAMLKRLSTSSNNLDSLIFISVSSFNLMDEYLRENGRTNISTLLVTGVWIEGLYLATQIVKDKPNAEIAERIGEQKLFMNDIILLLSNYKSDQNFQELIVDLESIKALYDGVKISYEVGEPEMIEKDGRLVIVQNEKSVVEITDAQLDKIIEQTEIIRSKIVNI
ncbi:MAG TPA: hypothetical protein DDX39_01100 [Bacteroidales bacterium]|nr:hypothetical protein [Bacteroidales bacterium]